MFKLICSVIILYCLVMLFIIMGGMRDYLFKTDLMVVLGTKVERDGTPSRGLEARLNKAISVYQQGYAPVILVSGGTGLEGYNEASVMAQYLVDHGIPQQAIIQDSQGVNTRATAKNTAEYMQTNHMKSVIIISQYFHIPRTKLAFQAIGIDKIGQGSPNYTSWRDFFSVPREMLGYPAYWLNLK
ncbi:Uncharacterized periplasmic protein SanA [Commensalibacter communis]|uniref:Affects membrane permeability for vancomycin (SanA) n=2 Tax=Commensalibacter communis TaxID=2972786 RepID=A0A9W4X7J8_9PROT|nr:YdcF family protein [Commensalibacter communis]CAI3950278.1 Uncharacterized periplasmic protein SanA [Commensalibacter communis]CAI3951243.1 Uncharacterized periplasmic protein SanA [Commensalibacter communis]CAI3957591.1 Uncharacterized periplasmic protein SanA [Commensalibacter communis]CAI3957673.1 Uncharacterized periplasmic protein SanA [Commensalibacter communis]CAI3959710.1 Uncharacterized periplasmic protein SanA [Commensalibacter communis]